MHSFLRIWKILFLLAGKSYYVIHFLNKFDISTVSASSNSTENFHIFTIHPMGLDLLDERARF